VLEPVAPVVLDELQAVVAPRTATAAAASNLLLVGIISRTFR
jgi:hypothetical protein